MQVGRIYDTSQIVYKWILFWFLNIMFLMPEDVQ
jgi:hypothetical protein